MRDPIEKKKILPLRRQKKTAANEKGRSKEERTVYALGRAQLKALESDECLLVALLLDIRYDFNGIARGGVLHTANDGAGQEGSQGDEGTQHGRAF